MIHEIFYNFCEILNILGIFERSLIFFKDFQDFWDFFKDFHEIDLFFYIFEIFFHENLRFYFSEIFFPRSAHAGKRPFYTRQYLKIAVTIWNFRTWKYLRYMGARFLADF